MSVRVDKYLQVTRMFKTRSQAGKACQLGRVRVNGHAAKAHKALAVGDRIEVQKGDWQRVIVVKVLRDKPVRKAEALELYEDLSPPPPAPDPIKRLMRRPAARREPGTGRPTKRDRRRTDRLRGD